MDYVNWLIDRRGICEVHMNVMVSAPAHATRLRAAYAWARVSPCGGDSQALSVDNVLDARGGRGKGQGLRFMDPCERAHLQPRRAVGTTPGRRLAAVVAHCRDSKAAPAGHVLIGTCAVTPHVIVLEVVAYDREAMTTC